MGIESRDYLRHESGGGSYGSFRMASGGWAIKYLIIANIAVFLLEISSPSILNFLALNRDTSLQIWRFITYGFCHAPQHPAHIFFNMFVLWMFGRSIEPILGSREFLAFYLVGIVISGICQIAISPNPVIGASGGVMAVVFLTAMIYPRMTVLLMFILPIELRWLAVLYAAVDVFGFINPQSDGVAHFAHLGGAAFGVAYKYFGWHLTGSFQKKWNRFKLSRSARSKNLRVYSEPDTKLSKAGLDEKVDAILEKISREGEASLTDQERELLKEASHKYKKR
ncbi:Rhomboid protease GluP [Gimesia alba]|uniref:Rhomboid protease GluP n=1 Tax=Gimesia alba TaxID=2527973 RepID=A0A517RF15_9PLAN|nr:rhomboid family intramembrane serine protease [Gimesia alba]QDT42469.1 Rhomboid protease GluP [Gimesia alba]